MADGNSGITISFGSDCKMKIELGGYEKMHLLDAFKQHFEQYNNAAKWFDDPKVLPAQKEQYMPVFQTMTNNLNLLFQILKLADVTDKDVVEHLGNTILNKKTAVHYGLH